MNNGNLGAGDPLSSIQPEKPATVTSPGTAVPGASASYAPARGAASTQLGAHVANSTVMPATSLEGASEAAPLTLAQRRWWLLEQLEPGKAIPCVAVRLRLQGALDPDALEAALSGVIDRHETLRMRFSVIAGKPVQIAGKPRSFRLARTDLGAIDAGALARVLDRLVHEDAAQPFDLSADVLMRARLVRIAPQEHVLQLVFHPLAADRSSVTVLCDELGGLYASFASGTVPLLPELPVRYSQLAWLERERHGGAAAEEAVRFWREQLAGAPSVLALPTDRVRPAVQTRSAGGCGVALSAKLSQDALRFAEAEGVSAEALFLAVFEAVVFRHSGQDDFVVGVPDAGRVAGESDTLIGPFENTLPLRARINPDASFRALLAMTAQGLGQARARAAARVERLVEELSIRREASHEPLCQVWFDMGDTASAERYPRIGELGTRVELISTGAFAGDLAVRVRRENGAFHLEAEFSRDLFDQLTIERLLGHVRIALEAAIAAPEQMVSRLPLLTGGERARLLTEWNATAMDYPRDRFVHQLFEDQVARTPQAVALVYNDREFTYADLNRRAEAVAARLRAADVGPDTPVALCAERSPEMVAGLLGILKAGAAYVPLDPAFPADRLTFMLEDCGARVLVTQRRLEALFGEENIALLLLDEEPRSGGSRPPMPARARPPHPDHLAYVLYTSGSTGKPKGVMVTHRNVVNFFAGMDAVVGTEPGVWLAVTSISFDISVLELFWTLTRGFKVVLLADQAGLKTGKPANAAAVRPDETLRSLDDQLVRHAVTHLQCTPSFARLLTRMPETLAAMRPLRRMLVGGEGLPADLAQTLLGALNGKLVNMYGPTETTVWSTSHVVETVRSGIVDIGRPIANTDIYILDAHRQPVPIGVPGELYIGGVGVARGYWRRPELTNERFLPNPFRQDGSRIYRTGDLARYRSDGVIEFIGRADHQVKIKGHRIELGEIEAVLAQHPSVAQSVVVVRTDNPDDPRLAAYVVAKVVGAAPDVPELKEFLREKLPAHMVPEFFVMLERLPLTPNGKIDRRALPAPAKPTPAAARPAATLPGSIQGIEHAISAIWSDILELDHLDADDNFFDSGGRSLHVVEVKNRLQESLGVEVPVIRLFQYPTIRSLAGFIGTQAKVPQDVSFQTQTQERTQRRHAAMAGMTSTTGDNK